jgi:tRNA threonylcarbamoyladenosine biosynthesis protein TsaE
MFLPDEAATRRVGEALGAALLHVEDPIVIALEGDLGAGKTTLVRGVLNALGFTGQARSPTYTLIEPYEHEQRCVYHLDLYRLADPREVEALAIRDLLHAGSVLLIEWPEKGAGSLPPFDLTVGLSYSGDSGREVELAPHSMLGKSVLRGASLPAKP